jgi:hypothetical protein
MEEFSDIQFDIPEGEIQNITETMVTSWLRQKLQPASLHKMDELLANGAAFEDVVVQSIFNEVCIEAIIEMIERQKAESGIDIQEE